MQDDETTGSSRRRMWWWLGGGAAVVVLVVALAAFQPWKLFVDVEVDEALPTVSAGPTEPTTSTTPPGTAATGGGSDGSPSTVAPTTAPPGPVTLAQGQFVSHDHPTAGDALALDVGGVSYVRFENLQTDNGPDLVVYLTTEDAASGQIGSDNVRLGDLKGNVGNQNYEVPAGVDVSDYSTVVIWCDRFSVAFGSAPLDPA